MTLIGRSFLSAMTYKTWTTNLIGMRSKANSSDEACASLLEEIADLGQQHDLRRRLRRFRGLGLFLALQCVHGTDHQEQHEGDDDEVDRQRQEAAVSKHGALLFRIR